MKFFRYIICFLLSIFCYGILNGAGDTNEEIQTLLNNAKRKTTQTSFISTTPMTINGNIPKTVKVYRKILDNGTFAEKVENIWNSKKNEFYIYNQSGTYVTIASQTYKLEHPPANRRIIYESILNKNDEWGKVVFNPPMSESLFKMPEASAKFVHDSKDLAKAKERAWTAFHSKQRSKNRR